MASSSLYIALITTISFICFALSCSATFLPVWGYFEDANSGSGFGDHGYFGPWKICKELTYNREKCGSSEIGSRFRPSDFVYVSGLMIVVSTLTLAVFCVLSVVQIAAISSREQIIMKYSSLVSLKMILAGVAGEHQKIFESTLSLSFSPPLGDERIIIYLNSLCCVFFFVSNFHTAQRWNVCHPN